MIDSMRMRPLITYLRGCEGLDGASETVWIGRIRTYFLIRGCPIGRRVTLGVLGCLQRAGTIVCFVHSEDGFPHYSWSATGHTTASFRRELAARS